jgi:hypothetical protein
MSDERELYEPVDLHRQLSNEEQKVRLANARRALAGKGCSNEVSNTEVAAVPDDSLLFRRWSG